MSSVALYLAIGLLFVVGMFVGAQEFDAHKDLPPWTWPLLVLGWPFFCGYVLVYALSIGNSRGGGPEQ